MDANDVRQEWAERSGEYSPEYYAYYGPNETSELIHTALERFVGRDASVLELGCSSGRHLAYLLDNGYEDLAGIELNDDAFDVMAEEYPELASGGTFYRDAIENVVESFDDGHFDVVYSVETLQHLHPDLEWVFEELARITDELLVTAEIEESTDEHESADADVNYVRDDFPLYYRDWATVFTQYGFEQVDVGSTKRDTVRTFRPRSE